MSDTDSQRDEDLKRAVAHQEATVTDAIDWSEPYAQDRYLETHAEAPVVQDERLFSRKVLIGWASAAFVIWFLLRVIAPIAMERVKRVVISRFPPTHNTAPMAPPSAPVTPTAPATSKAPEPKSRR